MFMAIPNSIAILAIAVTDSSLARTDTTKPLLANPRLHNCPKRLRRPRILCLYILYFGGRKGDRVSAINT